MSLKILHITSNGNIGGREKMLFQLVNLENKDDAIVPTVFFKYPIGPYCGKISALGIDTINDYSWRAPWRTIRNFESYDVLVFHFVDWFLFLCAALSGKPILYRLSGVYLLTKKRYRDVPKIFLQVLLKKLRRRKRQENAISKDMYGNGSAPNSRSVYRIIKRYYFSIFLRYFCDRVVVNSRYTAFSANRHYGVPFSKIKVIYNGVDILPRQSNHSLFREEFKFKNDDFLIGTVCRFDSRKRIDRLLEGFLPLQNHRYKLIIVGGGDQKLEDTFKQFVRDHEIADRVFFTGFRDDVDQIVSALDLFILPSDNEAFGVAVIEAMIMEKPVIVFNDSGGPVEIVGTGHQIGFVIDRPDEIAQIAMRLNQYPEFGKQMGQRAAKIVTEKFSIGRFQQEFKKYI